MLNTFTPKLTFYKTTQPSSIDLTVTTQSQDAYGFQFVADIYSDSLLVPLDQNPDIEGIQLDIVESSELNFVTNKIYKNENGYTIVVAAITKNPKQFFNTQNEISFGKIIFTQSQAENIIINIDQQKTKLALHNNQESIQLGNYTGTFVLVPEETGNSIEYSNGSMYSYPENLDLDSNNEDKIKVNSETNKTQPDIKNNTEVSGKTGQQDLVENHTESIKESTVVSHLEIDWIDFMFGSIFTLLILISILLAYLAFNRKKEL
jgi:hypothetical protein